MKISQLHQHPEPLMSVHPDWGEQIGLIRICLKTDGQCRVSLYLNPSLFLSDLSLPTKMTLGHFHV